MRLEACLLLSPPPAICRLLVFQPQPTAPPALATSPVTCLQCYWREMAPARSVMSVSRKALLFPSFRWLWSLRYGASGGWTRCSGGLLRSHRLQLHTCTALYFAAICCTSCRAGSQPDDKELPDPGGHDGHLCLVSCRLALSLLPVPAAFTDAAAVLVPHCRCQGCLPCSTGISTPCALGCPAGLRPRCSQGSSAPCLLISTGAVVLSAHLSGCGESLRAAARQLALQPNKLNGSQ